VESGDTYNFFPSPRINESRSFLKLSTNVSSISEQQDYRCWENSSIGDFLTPEISLVVESDEPTPVSQDTETLKLNDTDGYLKRKSVTFQSRRSGEAESQLSVELPRVSREKKIKQKRKAGKMATINYSIVIANELLQNIVVSGHEESTSSTR